MKKRRWFSLFLSFALLLPLFSLTSADAYEDFTLDAKAGLLIEADTGEILYEKNAHQENYPASLTKVMVALLVFEAIDEGKIALTDSVTATESAFEGLSSDGSTANIVPGETMTVEQLLNCMLIVSANEACNILGETLYGSVDAFVARMNERAAELGCEHTHFANATGLHNSQHYTTAWDLYLITREALKHDKFMEICISVSATAADYTPAVYTNYGPGTTIAAPGGDQDYYYEYFDDNHKRGEIGCILSTLPYTISETGYGYMEGTSMACPHVSGVAALGLSYAAQLRRHFTADEFKALLCETTTPIDSYMTGLKNYYRYVAEVGLNQPMQLTLANYRNQMGTGQVNAARLLNAVSGNGKQVSFPNLYISLGKEVKAIPANYFLGGETLTYTVSIADTAVATASMEGAKLTVRGLKAGTTKASITSSKGETHNFNITVRKTANGNGWL